MNEKIRTALETEVSLRPGCAVCARMDRDGTVSVEVKGALDAFEEWPAIDEALQHLSNRGQCAITHGGKTYGPKEPQTDFDPWGET